MMGSIFLVGLVICVLQHNKISKWIAYTSVIVLAIFTLQNVTTYINAEQKENGGNSFLRNELAAIDLVYKKADGKNFKVYTYMPSVYDFPYQYLFWWHG